MDQEQLLKEMTRSRKGTRTNIKQGQKKKQQRKLRQELKGEEDSSRIGQGMLGEMSRKGL